MKSHCSSYGLAVAPKADRGRRAGEAVHAHVFGGEKNPPARAQPCVGQVFDDLVLTVDGDRFSAGQCEQVDTVAAPPKAQFKSAMDQALAPEALADPRFVHQVDGALLEHAGAHALLDVLAAAILDHHGFDAGAMQQMREHQSRRPRPDYSDLRAHLRRSSNLRGREEFLDGARDRLRLLENHVMMRRRNRHQRGPRIGGDGARGALGSHDAALLGADQ